MSDTYQGGVITDQMLQTNSPLRIKTRASSRAGSKSPSQSVGSRNSRKNSADGIIAVGGSDIDAERPAKRTRLMSRSSGASESRSPPSQQASQDSPQKTNGSQDYDDGDGHVEMLRDGDDDELRNDGPISFVEETNGDKKDDGYVNSEVTEAILPRRGGRRAKRSRPSTPEPSGLATPIPGTPFNGMDGGTGANTDQDPSRAIRRLPGRRRAPNPNVSIEADLRRQLNLKMGYRSVAKALKPILAELARRSIEELQNDVEAHKKHKEFDAVMSELERRLQVRLAQLESYHRLEKERIDREEQLFSNYAEQRYETYVENLREEYVARGLSKVLEIYRAAEKERDEDLTDDEDGVIPPLYGAVTETNPTGLLDKRYDSRSRFYQEVEFISSAQKKRYEAGKQLVQEVADHQEEHDEDPLEIACGLGTFDRSRREEAIGLLNFHTLGSAVKLIEKEESQKKALDIKAEDAEGLQALASAVEIIQAAPVYPDPLYARADLNNVHNPLPGPPHYMSDSGAIPPPQHHHSLPTINEITSPADTKAMSHDVGYMQQIKQEPDTVRPNPGRMTLSHILSDDQPRTTHSIENRAYSRHQTPLSDHSATERAEFHRNPSLPPYEANVMKDSFGRPYYPSVVRNGNEMGGARMAKSTSVDREMDYGRQVGDFGPPARGSSGRSRAATISTTTPRFGQEMSRGSMDRMSAEPWERTSPEQHSRHSGQREADLNGYDQSLPVVKSQPSDEGEYRHDGQHSSGNLSQQYGTSQSYASKPPPYDYHPPPPPPPPPPTGYDHHASSHPPSNLGPPPPGPEPMYPAYNQPPPGGWNQPSWMSHAAPPPPPPPPAQHYASHSSQGYDQPPPPPPPPQSRESHYGPPPVLVNPSSWATSGPPPPPPPQSGYHPYPENPPPPSRTSYEQPREYGNHHAHQESHQSQNFQPPQQTFGQEGDDGQARGRRAESYPSTRGGGHRNTFPYSERGEQEEHRD